MDVPPIAAGPVAVRLISARDLPGSRLFLEPGPPVEAGYGCDNDDSGGCAPYPAVTTSAGRRRTLIVRVCTEQWGSSSWCRCCSGARGASPRADKAAPRALRPSASRPSAAPGGERPWRVGWESGAGSHERRTNCGLVRVIALLVWRWLVSWSTLTHVLGRCTRWCWNRALLWIGAAVGGPFAVVQSAPSGGSTIRRARGDTQTLGRGTDASRAR